MIDLFALPSIEPKQSRDRDGLHKRRGYWYYSLVINGRRRFFSTRVSDYQKARKIYASAQKEHEEGQHPSDWATLPFNKAAEKWITERTISGLAENTLRTERERIKPLCEHFRDSRIRAITLEHIMDYRSNRTASVGPRTINLEIKVLRMILGKARCWKKIGAEYKPLRENKKGPGRALTHDQLCNLIETAASKPEWDAAFLAACIASNTTMRGGEIKKLRHRHVDLAARLVTIEREGTKTDAGVREIPLNDDAALAFTLASERANRLSSTAPDHFLFPAFNFRYTKGSVSVQGLGYDPTHPVKTWRTAWRSLRKAAGLPTFRFHDLRHTAITTMAVSGVPIPTIMAVAGHLNREMTDHYTHVANQAKAAAVATLSSSRPKPNEPRSGPLDSRVVVITEGRRTRR